MAYTIKVNFLTDPGNTISVVESQGWDWGKAGSSTWKLDGNDWLLWMENSGRSGMLLCKCDPSGDLFSVAVGVHNWKRWCDVKVDLAPGSKLSTIFPPYYSDRDPENAELWKQSPTSAKTSSKSVPAEIRYTTTEGQALVATVSFKPGTYKPPSNSGQGGSGSGQPIPGDPTIEVQPIPNYGNRLPPGYQMPPEGSGKDPTVEVEPPRKTGDRIPPGYQPPPGASGGSDPTVEVEPPRKPGDRLPPGYQPPTTGSESTDPTVEVQPVPNFGNRLPPGYQMPPEGSGKDPTVEVEPPRKTGDRLPPGYQPQPGVSDPTIEVEPLPNPSNRLPPGYIPPSTASGNANPTTEVEEPPIPSNRLPPGYTR